MTKTRAYQVSETGGKTAGRYVELDVKAPDPGEVLVQVAYSSLNYKDALAATGAGKIMRRFPMIGGIDLSGVVRDSADPRFKSGDRVLVTGCGLGENADGGFTQVARVKGDWLVTVPPGLSLRDAMSIGTAGFTAALAVQRLEGVGLAPAKGPLVVNGASGGVGSLAISMLAQRGYHVTAVTGKSDTEGYLRGLGANDILSRHDLDYGSRPLEKACWAGAVDSVGGQMLSWLMRTMQPWGAIASCGLVGGAEFESTVMPFILRGVSILGIDSVYCPMPLRQELWQRLARDLLPRSLSAISHIVSFEGLSEHFQKFLEGRVVGRMVVAIRPEE